MFIGLAALYLIAFSVHSEKAALSFPYGPLMAHDAFPGATTFPGREMCMVRESLL